MKKEIYVYSILLCFSFTISMLLSFGVKVPSPANLIEKVVFAIVGEK
ncbi:hypothetical protein [Sporosalibacterium faouarense]|nr:hypothetical protein [Sporosalibacterium faouarense]